MFEKLELILKCVWLGKFLRGRTRERTRPTRCVVLEAVGRMAQEHREPTTLDGHVTNGAGQTSGERRRCL